MRLLLAEDERDLAAAIARGLAGEGYAVEVVHDGLDGLWRAREGSYAAIVLDVLLPGMDGFAICRTLRSENVWTPILILTAKNAPADEAKALDIGADDFLAKPFSFEVLLARLRAIQRRGTAPRPSKLMLGDLSLDPTTRECRARRHDNRPDAARVRAARCFDASSWRDRPEVRSFWTGSGVSTSMGRPPSWRYTSAISATRSIGRSELRSSVPCVAWATNWRAARIDRRCEVSVPRFWRPIRFRVAGVTTALIGLVIVAASIGFFRAVESALTDSVEARLRTQIALIEAEVVVADDPSAIAIPIGIGGSLFQLRDGDARIVAASPGYVSVVSSTGSVDLEIHSGTDGGLPPAAVTGRFDPEELDADWLIVSQDVRAANGVRRIVAAHPLFEVRRSLEAMGGALWLAVPLLIALVGAVAWFTTSRALKPVRAMTHQTREISQSTLDRRLPAPGTGDEISDLATTLNAMLERLETATHRQRRFISDASHELLGPLTTLQTTLEVSLRDARAADWNATAQTLQASTHRLIELASDLLESARLDERADHTGWIRVALDETVIDATRAVEGVILDTRDVKPAVIIGDPAALARVARNVLENASRHARHAVAIELSARGDSVLLAVEDDGPGIPPADRERVFERFVRLDDARTRDAGGSGLGLALVKQIVDQHGGHVRIRDGRLGGARVEIEFERAPER